LEPPLRNIKKKVTYFISRFNLYPVLDICCGSGVQCYQLLENGDSAYGLDLDRGMINYAASKYPHIPFVCADAANIPVKDSSMRGAILSYALHDKFPETRSKMLQEIRRILRPEGKVVFVDFEAPWNGKSRMASLYVYWIERMAGKEHFKNGRQFLQQGGLRSLIRQNGIEEIERHDIELAHTSVVVGRFA
jgi:demethylmenaquinone methyltransferase/2-methoxy-6-polyprenyl-1,4-benzoquinol methylase